MVYLCESFPVPAALAPPPDFFTWPTQPRPSASSWEFFITLDYEWGVIRGRHRPYHWTIWVRGHLFLRGSVTLPTPRPRIDPYLL
jgi:hypothetical protein